MNLQTAIMTYRNQFLQQLASEVSALHYAVLKHFGGSPVEVDAASDLDILIKKSELNAWIAACRNAVGLKHLSIKRRYYVTFVALYFEDESYLELDLLTEMRRKSYAFMDTNEVIASGHVLDSGWKVARASHSMEYLFWFYGLNGAPVPDRYIAYFESLAIQEQIAFNARFGILGEEGMELLKRANKLAPVGKNKFPFWNRNALHRRIIRVFQYVHNSFRQTQPVLTFSGVDGAGKSTVISNVQEMLSEKYRRNVVVLRHRPSLLPILSSFKYGKKGAEQRAAKTLPRQGTNKSSLSSLLRFVYYLLDYLIGQVWIKCFYSMRGRVVLYDRYYYDFIVDGRRTNINLPSRFTKALLPFISKPSLNILLYAAPEVILKRKQELAASDILSLTQGYKALFESLDERYDKAKYLCIENHDLNDTLLQIERAFVEKTQRF